MPDDLRIRIVGDVTQLVAPMEEAAEVVEDSAARMAEAIKEYEAACEGTVAQQEAASAAFDAAAASGLSFVASMEAGTAAAEAASPAALKAASAAEKKAAADLKAAAAAEKKNAADLKAAVAATAEAEADARRAAQAQVSANVSAAASDTQRAAYQRLAAATLEARAAQQQIRDITASVAAGELDEAAATTMLAEAQARAAVAARELAAADRQETLASEGATITRRQASAELNLLTGNLKGTRAGVLSLAQSFPILGEAMAGAFAAVEIIGVLYLLYQVGSKIAELAHDWDDVAQAEERAAKAAGKVVDAMDAAVKQNEKVTRELIEDAQGRAGLLKYDLAEMKLTVTSNDATVIAQAQARVDRLQARIKAGTSQRLESVDRHGGNHYETVTNSDAKAAEAEMQNAQTQLATARIQQEVDQKQAEHLQHQLTAQEAADAKKNAPGDDKAAQEKLRAIEATYARLNAAKISVTGSGLTAMDGLSFWGKYLTAFHEGSSEALKVLEDFSRAQAAVHAKIVSDAKTLPDIDPTGEEGRKALDEGEKAMRKWQLEVSEDLNHTGERWKQYNEAIAKAAEITVASAGAMQEAQLRIGVANGTISAQSAAYIKAGIDADAYRLKLVALEEELRKIQADPNLTTVQKATQSANVQNQIAQTKGQQAVTSAQDQAAITNSIAAPYLKGFDAINNGWLGVQGKLILGTKNIGRDFANMGANLVNSVATSFEKMLAKQAQVELQMLIAHQVTNAGKIASDATASTVTVATSQRTALQQIAHEAHVAAAKTYSALAGIPIVGPIIAPIGAAAAYVGVMALAAFETGGIVPKTGVVLAHEKEGILPRNLTEFLINAADRSTGATAGASHSSSFNQTNNYQGISDRQHRAKVMQHSDVQYASVRRELRRQGAV